jgi:hypothetical protein
VTGFDVADVLERQDAPSSAGVVGGDGLEQEAEMVAERKLADHAADEPVLACVEDRGALGSGVPLGFLELVDAVARLTAEQLGEFVIFLAEEVHREYARPVGITTL